jgi:hypothetical protein
LRGQINELNLEIDSIKIENKWRRTERVGEVLQLWRNGDHHVLRFFQNIPNQMFAEYRTTHLVVDPSKKKFSREDPRILKLISNVRLDPSSDTSIRIRFGTKEEKKLFGSKVQFNSP